MSPGNRPFLSTWQWLTLVGVLTVTGVSTTVWAVGYFQPRTDAVKQDEKIETLHDGMDELRLNVRLLMKAEGVDYQFTAPRSGN